MGWQSGHKIGTRFVIEGRLAMGGMAQVYVAEMQQAAGMTRKVALKRVHPHLAEDAEFVSMFVDEARILSQLAHPGIVPVVDAIEHAGDLMLVMDYVPGWDLKAVLSRARERGLDVPVGVVARVAQRTAETLAYVHEARAVDGSPLAIVHRDVTPSNLLVGTDGRVRLLDFGVAKAARRSTRTATRAIKGKLAYLAPEQARGEGATSASDIYALGLVLWEALAGRRAIEGDDDFQMMQRAAAPSLDAMAMHRPDTPEALDALVRRALEVEPSARPGADAVARELAPFACDDPEVAAFVASVMSEPSRPVEAGRSAVDQALLSVLAEGTFSGVSLAGERITRPPAEPVVAPVVAPESAPASAPAPAPAIRFVLAALLLLVPLGVAAWFFWPAPSTPEPSTPEPAPTAPPAFVRISTEPPGATVELADEPVGDPTPTVLEMAAGTPIELTLRLDDHTPVSATVTPREGETVSLDRTLARLRGRLAITSTPSGAEVSIDGEVRGTTPLTLEQLPRGPADVRVRADGPYRPFTRRVDLDAEASVELDVTLARVTPRGGTLVIMALPATVRVQVDGRAVRAGAWPLRVPVGPGRHTVVVTNPANGRRARRTANVTGGDLPVVGIDLR